MSDLWHRVPRVTTHLEPLALPTPADALAWLSERADSGLARARELVETLKANPPADAMAALEAWNDVAIAMGNVASASSFFSEAHPDEAVRSRGELAMQDVTKLSTELSLDRELYDLFAQVTEDGLDPQAIRLLHKTLRDFRRSGVDKDETTRDRVREINDRLTVVGQEFSKAIRDDVRTIRVTLDELAGLPQDWLDGHPADEDGLITVTTDYPDLVPVVTFCTVRSTREALRVAFLNRAWPDNDARLKELFALRQELAELVGYASWADYDAEVKMIGSSAAIPTFIDKIADAAYESGVRDRQVLLERMRHDRPEATEITAVDSTFYEEVVRREQLAVDAQLVRTYFDFAKVRQGLLDVTGRLLGVTYVPAADAQLWDDEVAAYDVFDGRDASPETADLLGRIYLDLHPREGKYKHAAQFDLRPGVTDRQLPEGVLVCNFPRGLMEHDQVVTLFHEFGHLVHHILGGRQRWVRFSGVATEWDFVEAPSQMLEEWAWDPDVLARFATNDAGEAIPADLVAKMRRADDFGKGYRERTQMFYAAISYYFHVERPADLTQRTRELQERYSLFPYLDDTHFTSSFGHLEGYSSGYYTYAWSLVIAKDLFSAFNPHDMFAPDVARRYREHILEPGGTRDAADLVEDFLGRPYTFDAYAAYLAQ